MPPRRNFYDAEALRRRSPEKMALNSHHEVLAAEKK
jgi:hypothetical protein